jgi:hypothetical protein
MPAPQLETQEKGEKGVETKYFQDFKGVYTKASRTAIPQDNFYDLQNLMPIGPANLHTVPGHTLLQTLGTGKTIYWAQYACLSNTDYLFCFARTGEIYAYNITANTYALINSSNSMGGVQTRMDQWKNSTILFLDTTGYYSWDGTTFAAVTGGIIPSGTLVNPEIAVYANHVWLYSNRLLYVSGINDYTGTGFGVAAGAVTQQLTDPQMRGQVVRMLSASGYLYLFFKSAIFLISDVYIPTSASPPAAVFSFPNVTAQVGSNQPGSMFLMGRDLMFANNQGLWDLAGVEPQRVSEEIDGTLQYLDNTFPISGGLVNVNNIQNGAFLFKTIGDPVFGTRYTIALMFDKKWWFSSTTNFTFIAGGVSGSDPALYGIINGNQLYQLFNNNNYPMASSWRTALWPMQDILSRKEVIRAGFEVSYINNLQQSAMFTLNVDTESRSSAIPFSATVGFVSWQNTSYNNVDWVNNSLQTVTWINFGYALYFGDGQGAYGKYVGFSGTCNAGSQYQLDTFMMDYKLRTRWT